MAYPRRVHETLAMQRNAGVGEDLSDFHPGDRVMTTDGFPGRVTAVNSGPYGVDDYEVTLDGGMGGGTYNTAQLSALRGNTAALHEAAEITASLPVEAVTSHTADLDYPELGTILYDRPPNENVKLAANKDNTAQQSPDDADDPGERLDQQDTPDEETQNTDENTDTKAAEEPADEAGKGEDDAGPPDIEEEKANNTPDVTPPNACSFCGHDEFDDPQMTGRGVRMRCTQCGGTMKSWGGQWEPEFPNSSQNQASGASDWSQGGAAGVANAPGANFKTTSLDVEAGIINYIVDKIYDRIQERKDHAILDGEWAWKTDFEGLPNYDTNVPCNHCGVYHPQTLHPNGLTIHGSLAEDYDDEWGFHFTATWQDVQNKARRIRNDGHVKIVAASKIAVVGEVQGDHGVYESALNYVPGTRKVADWACGCKWGAYTWGRSPKYRRFEGRLCSHALALQYEANSRGMFGRDVAPDTQRPDWQQAHHPVQVQYQRPTSREDGREIRRRAVPPGNMHRTFPQPYLSSLEKISSDIEPDFDWPSDGNATPERVLGRQMRDDATYASSNARDASTQALRDKTPESHHAAAVAHLRAAQMLDQIPGYGDTAAQHREDAAWHMTKTGTLKSSLLDTDGIYESPELLDLVHPPIFASVQEMAEHGEGTENIIEMLASFGTPRQHVAKMILKIVHEDENGKRRDGDEIEVPDGDRFNHGKPDKDDDLTDPESVRANQRDLSDHDDDEFADEHKKKRHRTNDAREHATHFGWGLPEGADIETCPQCNGSGCGHCAGQGQIVSGQSNMSSDSPDQTDDSGDVVSGLSTNGAMQAPCETPGAQYSTSVSGDTAEISVKLPFDLPIDSSADAEHLEAHMHNAMEDILAPYFVHTADYSSADPLAGVDQQTYYSPTNHSNSKNPASTGWATSQDPGDWGTSVITNNFGLTTDAALNEEPTVAGALLRARDTGRLLMIQRALSEEDPAAGTWEAPGGHLEEGETPLSGAVREFEEETGHPFPNEAAVLHTWRSGPYRGHLIEVPTEGHLDFSRGRMIENPDGDHHEQVAWWDPDHARKNPALRKELRSAPWDQFKKAAASYHTPLQGLNCKGCGKSLGPDDEGYDYCPLCHNQMYGSSLTGGASHPAINQNATFPGTSHREYDDHLPHSLNTLLNDPDEVGALPFTTGDADGDVFPGQTGGSSGDTSLPHASTDALHTDSGGSHTIDSLHQAFLNSPGAQAMMADLGITKSAMKDFSYGEQQDLINEGQGDRARNFGDLKIAGTHYEHIRDDEDGDLFL